MPTTTNYGWTTPADTDLVKDGAAAIRTLGSSIDTTVFNNANAAIAKTIVDAKGDIIAATAADTVSRLAVGANDTVLTADSSTATGLKWAAPASGGMTLISTTTLTGASVTLNSIPQTYNNLQIIVQNFKPATDAAILYMRFNGVTTYSYNQEVTTTSSGQMTWDWTEIQFGQNGQNDNSVANGLFNYEIPNYANTTTWKTGLMYGLTTDPLNTARFRGVFTNFYFNSTSAISSITFLSSSGNMTSGTVLLYGVK